MSILDEKTKLRAWAKEQRTNIDLGNISEEIIRKIKELSEYKSSKNVMSYLGKDIEISLNSLFCDSSKNWFLPSVSGSNLIAVPYFPNITILETGPFNIQEPKIENGVFFDQISKKIDLDLILIPGLCFDKKGNRLGYGKGFYDSFLKLNPNSTKIGVCPKKCFLEEIPSDSWDIKMDFVITE